MKFKDKYFFPKQKWTEISQELKNAGYEHKRKAEKREKERLFFMSNLPDKEVGTRLYHIHLSYPKVLNSGEKLDSVTILEFVLRI